jgi:CRP/FNR family cyclic AMP-dependent transcriptional regulator
MAVVDANVLLYAIDSPSAHHKPARSWLDDSLGGSEAVAWRGPSCWRSSGSGPISRADGVGVRIRSSSTVSSYFDYPTDEPAESALTFLADRGEADWAIVLDHTETRRFTAGEEVIRAGEDDRALYLLTEGSLAVASDAAFRTIDAPSVVGEVAFLDGGKRSLTLVATTDGELRRLGLDSFEALAGRHPELARAMLFDLGKIVSLRLRFLTELIEDGVS